MMAEAGIDRKSVNQVLRITKRLVTDSEEE